MVFVPFVVFVFPSRPPPKTIVRKGSLPALNLVADNGRLTEKQTPGMSAKADVNPPAGGRTKLLRASS